jgi:hypothetical protein
LWPRRRWANELDPHSHCFEIFGAVVEAWRGAAAELAEERAAMIQLCAADTFTRLRSCTRHVAAWKEALRFLQLLRAGQERLVARRRRRLLAAEFARFRAVVDQQMEARAAEETRVARAGLRSWRAEFRREKGGERQKRRVLREWGKYAKAGRREWPALHRRGQLLAMTCAR